MEKYSDIDIFLQKNDLSGDISFKQGIYSVSQSLMNIALTRKGERIFYPNFGTNLLDSLENSKSTLQFNIEKNIIISQLQLQEPRAIINDLTLNKESEQSIVTIYFTLKDDYSSTGTVSLTV